MAPQTITSIGLWAIVFPLVLAEGQESKMNVLFLVADDMRPQLGAYLGPDFPAKIYPKPHTPNLDKLAARSLFLKRAYVQEALCSPSRTSLLTGRRPDTTHVYQIGPYFRKVGGNFTTLPQYFKYHGYRTVGMGKIFHPGAPSGHDDPISWTDPYYHPPNQPYWDVFNVSWRAVPKAVRQKKPLEDEQLSDHANMWLENIVKSNSSQPFFLAVGMRKPHLPFVFPEEFLDYYPSGAIRLPENQFAPKNFPKVAWYDYPGLRNYWDIKALHKTGKVNTTLPASKVLQLRRAYYSALSYSDAMLGKVIDKLYEVGLANNTIISFWGDHGFQLGEHGEWCKQTNFELATHAPMMVHIPGKTNAGIKVEALTEFVDLYPTLVEAAGLPQLPLCPEKGASSVDLCREGESLMPLVEKSQTRWKNRVFSQFPRGDRDHIMGYSMRTDRFRYTEWVEFLHRPQYKPLWNISYGVELYDHYLDQYENRNVAGDAKYRPIVKQLSSQLHAGWRAAIPSQSNIDADWAIQNSKHDDWAMESNNDADRAMQSNNHADWAMRSNKHDDWPMQYNDDTDWPTDLQEL